MPLYQQAAGRKVAADDLLMGRFPADFVVNDAVAGHVHAHIRGRFVGRSAVNALEYRFQHGENFHVPVVVDRGLAIGFQMEGVDHVHVVQIGGGGLIGDVHRMVQGKIPDGEGLKFGVARLYALLVLLVQLAQTDRHFAASGAGRGDNDQRTAGFHIFVAAKSVVADDLLHVVGITLDGKMPEYPDAQIFQPLLEQNRVVLVVPAGHDHAAHIQADAAEGVDQPQHVRVIGDAQIAPHFAFFDVVGVDGDDQLGLILQIQQHPHLAVRQKAGKHPGSVIIVEELAAEFHVELSAKGVDALPDAFGLHGCVFVVVKPDMHRYLSPFQCTIHLIMTFFGRQGKDLPKMEEVFGWIDKKPRAGWTRGKEP